MYWAAIHVETRSVAGSTILGCVRDAICSFSHPIQWFYADESLGPCGCSVQLERIEQKIANVLIPNFDALWNDPHDLVLGPHPTGVNKPASSRLDFLRTFRWGLADEALKPSIELHPK